MLLLLFSFFFFSCLFQNEIKTAVYSKRKKLARAFDILKVKLNGKDCVTLNRWVQLMRIVVPSKSGAQLDLMMKVLDVTGDGVICMC
jgi:two pore calcium channel protein 3